MKKTIVSIHFDDEKLSAIKLYMNKKDADLDAELTAQLEKLYGQFVPSSVREFIAERYPEDDAGKKKPDGK